MLKIDQQGGVLFDHDEAGYQQWLQQHPQGFVVNSYRKPRVKYLPLHKASCHTISEYRQYAGKPAFTGGAYVKVCAPTLISLIHWLDTFGASKFSALCTSCRPDVAEADALAQLAMRLAREATALQKDPEELAKRLSVASKKPGIVYVTTKAFVRNPAVVAAILIRAKGVCEGCGKPAPFLRAGDGTPYLEVHHVQQLSDGGDDSVENATALCPNCHRRRHFGSGANDK